MIATRTAKLLTGVALATALASPALAADVTPEAVVNTYADIALAKYEDSLATAKALEEAALSDPYFAEKKLFPNVDFYSGIILEAMGFPTSMFTPIFALSRTVGWVSQWKEMLTDPQNKIGRPRQLYLGETARDYVDIEKR